MPGICIIAVLCYCLYKPVPTVISITTLIDAGVSIDKSPVEEFLHVLPIWLDLPSYDVMNVQSLPEVQQDEGVSPLVLRVFLLG